MKNRNRIAILNILSTVILNGIALFTTPLFTRLLGDSGYGALSIYSTWAACLAILFTVQTQSTLANARVEYAPEAQDGYQSSVMSLSVAVFSVLGGLMLIFREPLAELMALEPRLLPLMLLQAFGTFCVGFLNTKFIYEFKAGRNMLISLGVTLATLGLSVFLVLRLPMETRYLGRATAIAAVYGTVGIIACVYILAKGRVFFRREYWKFCLLLALPAVFHNLSDLILGQSDRIMLQRMLSTASVGHYNSAWQLGNVLFVLFEALNRTWCPYFFEEFKAGEREKVRQKTVNYLELFTVLSVGFILLAPEVFHIYAPQTFWPGTQAIPLFATSYYLNFLCTFPVNYEYYHKKTGVVALVTFGSSLLNLGLNYLFIRAFGLVGAALATAVSHGAQLLGHYLYTRYVLGKGDYPFGVRVWGKYALGYCAGLALTWLAWNLPLVRWIAGPVLGVWELLRIRKRKVLI